MVMIARSSYNGELTSAFKVFSMQPFINIALRSIRTAVEQIQFLLEREGPLSFGEPDRLKRIIQRVDGLFSDELARALERAYPTHMLAKKGSLEGNKGYSWHIQPLHNSASMARGLKDWAFSVVCKKNGRAEHALVIVPQLGDEYTASRGSGAALNGKRLRVSKTADPRLALISSNLLTSIGTREGSRLDPAQALETLGAVCLDQRASHCLPLDLCQLAAGNVDAVVLDPCPLVELEAGLLIAAEAGALSCDTNGQPFNERSPNLICANPRLLKNLSPKIRSIPERDFSA